MGFPTTQMEWDDFKKEPRGLWSPEDSIVLTLPPGAKHEVIQRCENVGAKEVAGRTRDHILEKFEELNEQERFDSFVTDGNMHVPIMKTRVEDVSERF